MMRVLQIVTAMDRGGLETMLMNLMRQTDRSALQFDFLVHRTRRGAYDDEIEALGGRIFRLPPLDPFSPAYRRALRDFFAAHPDYRIVHSHLDCLSAVPLAAAARAGVPVRIAHSHNSAQDKNAKYPLKLLLRAGIPRASTALFACGTAAGRFLFGNRPFTVLPNGIRTAEYAFDFAERENARRRLGLKNALVIGHVGAFRKQKNHRFLLRIFAEIRRKRADAKLLLVGDGTETERIRALAQKTGLSDDVLFLGSRSDVASLLCAMDVFIFPSHYEGFPVTLVEAQTAGLPCVISDRISPECIKTDAVRVCPLSAPADVWADAAIASSALPRRSGAEEMRRAGFDVADTALFLRALYERLSKDAE